ncbi:MFS transporter [Flaviaesturariibacter aridisoli]|uniref:MFS transporter n=1 Tax=Flaviaesturariibacter aridisoli TaxID=2545761 RepID=A0A4R4E088_9BACT|nr:MFS transporter [Flaviaesturariibacter aridisoli]TCZ70150.1 MFS transporter [Flaviaesturariibacter aridisoli]
MPATLEQRPHSLAPLLYHSEFRLFIIARFFYTMSLRMVGTVVAYQLFQLTRSSFSIGISGLSEFVPVFCLALYAGYLIDRSDKRTLLLKGILSYSLCVAGLVVLTMPQMTQVLSRSVLPVFFYGIIFFTGVIRAFAGPTTSAIIAQLVPRNILHLASAISSSTFLISSIVGHASAGLLIAAVGVHATFVVVLMYVLLAAFLVSRISRKPVLHNSVGIRAMDSVKEGLRFVFRNKIMLGAISLDLFAVLFGGAVALIPEIADRILKVGPQGFGLLNAAIDIGSAVTLLFNTFFPLRRRQGTILLFAVFGFGLCIIVFGLSNFFWMSFVALLVAGMLDGISVVIRGTVLQLTTPDQMRGRVSAVNSMFINSSNELGQFESGFSARLLGTVPAVLFGGFMTIIVVLITWWRAPGLRKFEY